MTNEGIFQLSFRQCIFSWVQSFCYYITFILRTNQQPNFLAMSFSLAQSCQLASFDCQQTDDFQSYIHWQLIHILNTLRQEMKQLQQKYENQLQNLKQDIENKDKHIACLQLQIDQLLQQKKLRSEQKYTQTYEASSQTISSAFQHPTQSLKKKKVYLNSQNIKNQKINKQLLLSPPTPNQCNLDCLKESEKSELLFQQNIKLQRLSQVYQDFIKIKNLSENDILRQAKTKGNYVENEGKQDLDFIKQKQFQTNNKIKLVQSYLVQDSDKKAPKIESLELIRSPPEQSLTFSNKKYRKNLQEVKSQTSISSKKFNKSKQKKVKKENYQPQEFMRPVIDIDLKITKNQQKLQKARVFYETDGIYKSFLNTEESEKKLNETHLSFKKHKKIYAESPQNKKIQQKSTILRSKSSKKYSHCKCLFDQLKSDESISDLMHFHRNYSNKTLTKTSRSKQNKSKTNKGQKKNQISHFISHNDQYMQRNQAENQGDKERININQRMSVPVSNKKVKISIIPIREISVKRHE